VKDGDASIATRSVHTAEFIKFMLRYEVVS